MLELITTRKELIGKIKPTRMADRPYHITSLYLVEAFDSVLNSLAKLLFNCQCFKLH